MVRRMPPVWMLWIASAAFMTAGCTDETSAEDTTQTPVDDSAEEIVADSAEDPADDVAETPALDPCLNDGKDGATATCLSPTKDAAYYVAEANAYFDTLDVDADPESVPDYHELVVRWEWPPWLLLTGYGKQTMIDTGLLLKELDPSTVPERDCRFFDRQPFARCVVVFEYEGGSCPIYEEFTFNDTGQMTFIEAWSHISGLTPVSASDPWAETTDIKRLSTRIPGLGNATGTLDLESSWMKEAAKDDADVADFALRATDQWGYWSQALSAAPKDFFAQGCGW